MNIQKINLRKMIQDARYDHIHAQDSLDHNYHAGQINSLTTSRGKLRKAGIKSSKNE